MAGIQELFDLTGRIAIVTGGATHLGLAMSSALGELGATLVIASRGAGSYARRSPPLCARTGWRALGRAAM